MSSMLAANVIFDAVFKSVAQMQGAALIIASADPLFGRRDGL